MDTLTITLDAQVVRPGESLFASAFFFTGTTPVSPTSVDYKVTDVATGDLVRDWTPCVPGFTSTSVEIEGADVELLVDSDLKEFRLVTFRATLGADTVVASATFAIINLGFQSIVVSLDCSLTPELERYLPMPSSRISRVVDLDNSNP